MLEQETWALLTLYQLLRTAMVTAIETCPGTDPDRGQLHHRDRSRQRQAHRRPRHLPGRPGRPARRDRPGRAGHAAARPPPAVQRPEGQMCHLPVEDQGRQVVTRTRALRCRPSCATADDVPLCARSAGQRRELAVTPGQPGTAVHLRTGGPTPAPPPAPDLPSSPLSVNQGGTAARRQRRALP